MKTREIFVYLLYNGSRIMQFHKSAQKYVEFRGLTKEKQFYYNRENDWKAGKEIYAFSSMYRYP